MNYEHYKEIFGDDAAEEYIIHALDDKVSKLASTTGRLIISKIKLEDTAATTYSFSLLDYRHIIGKDNIKIRDMKKAFKELKKVKVTIKLPSGRFRARYFDKIKIPLFGEVIEYRLNKATFPYLQNFRR